MRVPLPNTLVVFGLALFALGAFCRAQTPGQANPAERGLRNSLVIAQRSDPRTFNPVFALDAPTRDLLRLLHGRLVRIHGENLGTEPMLAEATRCTADGLRCLIKLRRGVRFSDGHPFDADDVVFSFQVYQDEKVGSAQRDLLAPNGKPVQLTKLGPYELQLQFSEPHAPQERLFDGIAILPKHLLERPYREGKLAQTWTVQTAVQTAAQTAGKAGGQGGVAGQAGASGQVPLVGLGPFVVAEYRPGAALTLRRNPYYFQAGKPRLEQVQLRFVADQTAESLRFRNGEFDLLQRPPAKFFAAQASDAAAVDFGPSLEYHFLFFNLNSEKITEAIRSKQEWFRKEEFRRAISLAVDRQAMVRLAFGGMAAPLSHHVTPGNRRWQVPHRPRFDRAQAQQLLGQAGFRRATGEGPLLDSKGQAVAFSLGVNSANTAQMQLATILQEDLRQVGIAVEIVPLEFRTLVDRLLKSREYEAALMALGSGDADPNSEMNIWLNSGGMHVWNLDAEKRPLPWETRIDELMRRQRATIPVAERQRLYGEVQQLVQQHLPIIPLVSPHLLVLHRRGLRGLRRGLTPPYALWNIEELSWSPTR